MINKHDFQQAAKSFRAGRLSLQQFTDAVFAGDETEDEQACFSSSTVNVKSSQQSADMLPQLGGRDAESHKGNFGRVLLIGGSAGMSGAIGLSSLAALRSGSGLVKVAVPREIQSTVAAFSPCYMTIGCLSEHGEFHGASLAGLETATHWSDVVGLGPGMERGAAQNWIVPKLYSQTQQPMVVDADALNTLADSQADLSIHAGQRILTPHPGEFQRLINSKITNRDELEGRAIGLAKSASLIIVLKGHRTLVTDGEQIYHNETGNPGMATAGSGDVLTGVITSLVGQGLSVFGAAALGVHLHGLSGDIAAQSVGETSLIATDIVEHLPTAFKKHAADRRATIGF
jgi:NAD(P)H-hydrate epimerase